MSNLKTVGVRFHNNPRVYHYLALEEMELVVGDAVIVVTPRMGPTVVAVVEIHEGVSERVTKRIASKVDLSEYYEWMETYG